MSTPDNTDEKSKRQVAIALKDDPATDVPSRITATGRGKVAEQIISIALANDVKVREDSDLAEVLSVLDVDSVVPVEVLATVSEILSYVYRANAAMTPRPDIP